jgi:hypothetical protein
MVNGGGIRSPSDPVDYGSLATVPAYDVRYYPQSDRDSDLLNGRYVPLATKVHRSKARLIWS